MIWNFDQWIEKKSKYPWIFCSKNKIGCEYCKEIGTLNTVKKKGVEISKEWSMCTVDEGNHQIKQTRLANIKKKVKKHSDSFAHQYAYEIKKNKKNLIKLLNILRQTYIKIMLILSIFFALHIT